MQKKLTIACVSVAAVGLTAFSTLGYLGKLGDILIFPTLLAVYGTSQNVHQPDPNGIIVALAAGVNVAIIAFILYAMVGLLSLALKNEKSGKRPRG